jgi:aminoglycoside N3'-acetyltransferase
VNDHVARFVVWGNRAQQLLTPQAWNYPVGAGSLLDRFVDNDSQILLLGCDHDNVKEMPTPRRGS